MGKNIVLCCDGTNNEFGDANTNVVKLYGALVHDTPAQLTYYHAGLGSQGSPYALTPFARFWTKVFGLGFGFGISQHLQDLYQYLMANYEPGDKLFVFGFSRGAYTARALCSMLHVFGLIRNQNTALVPYAIGLLKKYGNGNNKEIAAQFRQTFSAYSPKPHYVGIWDTVTSVGGLRNPLQVPFSRWNPDVQTGRHAIAIDERRAFYRQNLWSPSKDQDLQQVWFAGVHCDVGGGYPEASSGLSKITLDWMMSEACKAGLLLKPAQVKRVLGEPGSGNAPPNESAELHNSMKKWWWAEIIPRRYYNWTTQSRDWKIPLAKRRWISKGDSIHESVFARREKVAEYKPQNIVSDRSDYTVVQTKWPVGGGQ